MPYSQLFKGTEPHQKPVNTESDIAVLLCVRSRTEDTPKFYIVVLTHGFLV